MNPSNEELEFYASVDSFFDTLLTEVKEGKITCEEARVFFPEHLISEGEK